MTDTVFEEIRSMVTTLLDQYGLDDVEITEDTLFHDDLGLESIDLVTLGGTLAERYGEQVNLAAFLAELEMDQVIGLRLGMLVDFVRSALGEKAGSAT
ncbi:MAG TPA: phosphopantetheine-binding protein [Pseudonocardiaceae bacterium]|nr:phosphopantetheine-binding protein [Pseudonocardiaceae bacterium]